MMNNRRRFFASKASGGESYTPPEWYYRAVNLDGTQDLIDSGLKLFGESITQWTLFYYIDDFPTDVTRTNFNVGGIFNGATVFVVNGFTWGNQLGYGTQIRYSQNDGYNFNKKTKLFTSSTSDARATGYACPLAIRRNGNVFTYSVDGRTWNELMVGYYTGNANNTLTIGMDAWNGKYRPIIDGIIEVAIWLDADTDISDFFDKYK